MPSLRGVYCSFIVEKRIVSDTAVHEIDHTMCVAKNLLSDEAMKQLLEASEPVRVTVDHVCRQMSHRLHKFSSGRQQHWTPGPRPKAFRLGPAPNEADRRLGTAGDGQAAEGEGQRAAAQEGMASTQLVPSGEPSGETSTRTSLGL